MNRDEYGRAYEAGFERTVRFLISRGVQSDAAQEAAQAAWARGWERLGQLRNEQFVILWVNTIALNAHRCSLRSESRHRPLPELTSTLIVESAAMDMDRVLRFCGPSERVLFEQRLLGATNEEIARDQGVTETAIPIRLMRARRAARSAMEQRAAKRRLVAKLQCSAITAA